MSATAKRTWVIEPIIDEQGDQVVDERKLEDLLGRLIGTLIATGGLVEIVADRVKIGELPDGEPLAETLGFVVKWRTIPVLHERSMTKALMDHVLEADTPERDLSGAIGNLEPDAGFEVSPPREETRTATGLTPDEEQEFDVADRDEIEAEKEAAECDCAGEHVPPCPFAAPIPAEEVTAP